MDRHGDSIGMFPELAPIVGAFFFFRVSDPKLSNGSWDGGGLSL